MAKDTTVFSVDVGGVTLPEKVQAELARDIQSLALTKLAQAGVAARGLAFFPIEGPGTLGLVIRDLSRVTELQGR